MKKFFITLFIFLFTASSTLAEEINVAFAIDNNYPIFTLLAINSILKNNKSNSHYNFYIVEDNLTNANKKKMTKYVTKRGQNINFINVNTDIIDNGDYLFGFSNRITKIGMARILLPDLLPKDVKKVLYLDGDILVTRDLKLLYKTNLDDALAGMCDNIQNWEILGQEYVMKNGYYNSGVILMDLDKWRQEDITGQMLSFIKNNKTKFIYEQNNPKVFLYPDQDLINIILNGRIKKLHQIWNNQSLRGISFYPDLNGIIHYIAEIKPWHYIKTKNNKTIKLYHTYWNHSGLIMYKYYYWGIIIKDKIKI